MSAVRSMSKRSSSLKPSARQSLALLPIISAGLASTYIYVLGESDACRSVAAECTES